MISSPGLVVKSQACHAEGPEFAPRTLQGVLFPVAAHHTTLKPASNDFGCICQQIWKEQCRLMTYIAWWQTLQLIGPSGIVLDYV